MKHSQRFPFALSSSVLILCAACAESTSPCAAFVRYGARVTVTGAVHDDVAVSARRGGDDWVDCNDFGDSFGCAVDMGGRVSLRATATDGRISEREVDVETDRCGPVFDVQQVSIEL